MHVPGGPDQAVNFVERGRLADGLGLHERLQALAVFGQVVGLSRIQQIFEGSQAKHDTIYPC